MIAAANSPTTSKQRSWTTRWEKSSPACAGSAREPQPGPSLRSATPTASPTSHASPPTPGSPPSTGNQGAAPQHANPEAATTDQKNAMFTAAFVAAQHDPDARAYYQRKRA